MPRSLQAMALPFLLASLAFLGIYLPAAFHGYGIFVDELYYLAATKRLAAGYVDHPPLSIWLLWPFSTGSLSTLRLLPALCAAGTIFLSTNFVRLRGGSLTGQVLSALATLGAPVLLVLFGFYSMNAIEVFFLTALFYLAGEMIRLGKPFWILFGILTGLAALNKHTSVVYSMALLAGMLLTPARSLFLSRSLFGGLLCALLIVLPNLIWQWQNDFASLLFYRNATAFKNLSTPPHMVLINQVLAAGPQSVILWLSGLFFLWRSPLRCLPIAYGICLALLIAAMSSRPDRIAAFYPLLFAAGALSLESRPRLRLALLTLVSLGFLVFAPIALPFLPADHTARYATALGVVPSIEKGRAGALPQWFADRLGWPELSRRVGLLHQAMPADTVVLAGNYGIAGALEHFTNLPVVSPHNAYHDWARPELLQTRSILLIGADPDRVRPYCEPDPISVVEIPHRNPILVLHCKLDRDLGSIWKELVFFL